VETFSKVVIQFVGRVQCNEKDRNNRNGNPIHVNPICGGMVCSPLNNGTTSSYFRG
jgi:hypothetical protein